MNRRQFLPIGSSIVAVSLFAVACGSTASSPGPTLLAPSAALPTFAIPSVAIPSVAIPSVALPSSLPSVALPSNFPSFVIPSIAIGSDGSFAIPSFAIPSFSFPSEDKDLEAKLPDSINGVPLVKYSFKGASFLASGGSNSQDLVDLLTTLGKSPDDLSIAFAGDPNGDLDVQLGAFRVAGADSNALLQAFVIATQKESPQDVVSQVNVGGKNVTQIVDPTDTENGTVYIYPNGDILYYVASPDPALAAAALQALP